MSNDPKNSNDPHADLPVISHGVPVQQAKAVIIMLHGRGASAESILSLFDELALDNWAAIAPQAAGGTWYPYSFLSPIKQNQPFLDSAMKWVESVVTDLIAAGVHADRIAILGFSQGACLALEFAARHPRRYASVIGLTGGLIGPPGTLRNYSGSLVGTPVFIGTSDPDPHVPVSRVLETEAVLTKMGATVEVKIYPGLSHTINSDEINIVRTMMQRVA